jgi:hypothetical protein
MLRSIHQYFAGIPSVFMDGFLYVCIAALTAITAFVTSDDAAKYIPPEVLFWGKGILSILAACVVSIKMFRSTSFAEHQAEKKKTDTALFIKP